MSAQIVVRVTFIGMVVNIILTLIKFLMGVFGRSSALVADSIHSLSDLITDAVVLIGVRFWNAPADNDHPHGHKKIEFVASFVIGIILFLVGVGIIYRGIIDLLSGVSVRPDLITLIAVVLSIVSKELLYRWTVFHGRRIKSSAVIANAWHHRSDALSSIPVFFSIIIAHFFEHLALVDIVGSMIVSGFIFQAAYRIMREAFENLVDVSAPPETIEKIKKIVFDYPEVRGLHHLRTRYLGSSSLSVDFHMEVEPTMPVYLADRIAHEVEEKLVSSIDEVVDVVIHIDPITPVIEI